MIVRIANVTLDAMPPEKAKAIRAFAHVNDGSGVLLPSESLAKIDAGMLSTPQMDVNEAMADCRSPLLGDRIESVFKKLGVARAMAAYAKWRGVPCNCADRKELMNAIDLKVREIAAKVIGGDV